LNKVNSRILLTKNEKRKGFFSKKQIHYNSFFSLIFGFFFSIDDFFLISLFSIRLLEIIIYFFNLFFIRLFQSHDLDHDSDLTQLTRVFIPFPIIVFFSQFHILIIGWLRIILHNLSQFAFYKVILVSWLGFQVCQINSSWLMLFFYIFFTWFFFQFYLSTQCLLGIELHNLFQLVFIKLS
jgi:hypothetical protein